MLKLRVSTIQRWSMQWLNFSFNLSLAKKCQCVEKKKRYSYTLHVCINIYRYFKLSIENNSLSDSCNEVWNKLSSLLVIKIIMLGKRHIYHMALTVETWYNKGTKNKQLRKQTYEINLLFKSTWWLWLRHLSPRSEGVFEAIQILRQQLRDLFYQYSLSAAS